MRKNAIVMIGLGVIAALIALFFLLDRDAQVGGPPRPPAAVPEIEAPATEGPAPAVVAESLQIEAIRPRRAAPDAPDSDAISPDDALRVLVVDESSGVPVPGAEVAWTDETTRRPRFSYLAGPSPLMSDFDRSRQKTVADVRGIAVVRTSERLAIAARSGDRFGLRTFKDAPRGEVRLPIAPGVLVAARVLNEAGAPVAGVGVVISVNLRHGRSSSGRSFCASSRDPDGLAIVHHTGVNFGGSLGDSKDINEITASIEGAGPDGIVKATVDDLKAGPITLTLRPTGRVVVKLADADGRPFLSETRVSLEANESSGRSMPATFEATTTGGSVEFPTVAVGSVLTVSAESAGFDTVRREKLEGPKSRGEDTTIEMRFVRQRAVVRGRAVDETGSPLSRRELKAELVLSEGTLVLPGPMRLATDARGEFSFTIDGGIWRLTEVDLLLEMLNGGDALERHVRTHLPKLAADGETWLGEVTLSRPKRLASGVVRDELGAPIAGALVTADNMHAYFPPGFELSIGSRTLPNGAQVYRARTDDSGAFEIPLYGLGAAKIGGFSLEAALDGYACPDPPAELKPGAKDVMIVLLATGVVEGRLVLPDLAPIRRLSLSVPVTDPELGSTAHYRFEDCVDSNGAFRLTGVRPGLAKLEVRLSGVDEPLASIPDVAVRRLETTDDARLRQIDLRGHPALRAR